LTFPSPLGQFDRLEYPASGAEGAARSEAKPSEVQQLAGAEGAARSEAKPSAVNRFASAQQPTAG